MNPKALIHRAARLLLGKNIWMVSDRVNAADDNGEAFFAYLQDKPVRSFFVLEKHSPDYDRLRRVGRTVPFGSLRYHLLCAAAAVNVSSQMELRCPYAKEVFLQHGVIMNDLHRYLNRLYNDRLYMLVSGEAERKRVTGGAFVMPEDHVWLTGLPRFDRLEDRDAKKVIVCLTWRARFAGLSDEALRKSDYWAALTRLMNDEALKHGLAERGYTLAMRLHPNMIGRLPLEQIPDDVEVFQGSYRDMFAQGSLLITDYSSVVFDFAYLGKPFIYYQFDRDSFFDGSHSFDKGDVDYEKEGLGEVILDHDTLRAAILAYADSGCAVKAEYRERTERFFAHRDRENCRRVYEKIRELTGD